MSTAPGFSISRRASSMSICLICERASSRMFLDVFAIPIHRSAGGRRTDCTLITIVRRVCPVGGSARGSAAEHPVGFHQGAQEIKDILRVAARSDLVECPPDMKIVVENKGGSGGQLAAEDPECGRERTIGIGQQDERKRMLFREGAMALDRVGAHSDYYGIEGLELLVKITELLAFH